MRYYTNVEIDRAFPLIHLYVTEGDEAALCGYDGEALCSSRGEQCTLCLRCLEEVRKKGD